VAHPRHPAPHVGDDVDDRPAGPTGGVAQHPLVDALARDEKAAGEVVAHDRVPAFRADRREPRRELAAGVVDERVDAAEARQHGSDRRLHLRFFADVADVRRTDAAGTLDLVADGVELGGGAADDRDRGAERRELVRGAAADPEPPPVTTATWPRSSPGAKTDR
jgi:hypothetical protein